MDFLKRFLDGRMIFERIETRIIVGITAFVATMILITWVAINENARMAAFERQFLARSIERGAALFVSNCATCHGVDGRGLELRGPALNNPQLFGWDPYGEIGALYRPLRDEQIGLNNEITILQAELDSTTAPPTDERRAEINARLEAINARLTELQPQIDELQPQYDALTLQLASAEERGYQGDYSELANDMNGYDRLRNLGWSGTLPAFIRTTLISGRPVSESYWDQPMPAWSQTAGGPLRQDQIDDLVNYVLNYNRDWTTEDLLAVQQFAIEPGLGGGASDESAVGTDSALATVSIGDLTGDSQRGELLYSGAEGLLRGGRLNCTSCHQNNLAPPTEGTWTRTLNERPLDLHGNDPVNYIVTSILQPDYYVVEPYSSGQMPANFGTRITAQELADLVAYLQSQDQ